MKNKNSVVGNRALDDSISQVSKNASTVMAHKSGHGRDANDFVGDKRKRNTASTRLTPKSSYGAGGKSSVQDTASQGGGSQVRQMRLSAH